MLSDPIKQIFTHLERSGNRFDIRSGEAPYIVVNTLTSKAGWLYEKLRYIVDYKDEHTIRRSAIERILKRTITFERKDSVGLILLKELVSAGYLPNDAIPEAHAEVIEGVVNTYRLLDEKVLTKHKGWVWSFAATEIEELLFPRLIDNLVVNAFYGTVVEAIFQQGKNSVSTETLQLQTYIACRRALLEEDDETLAYVLFRRLHAHWSPHTVRAEDVIESMGESFEESLRYIHKELSSDLSRKISLRLKDYAIYFSLFQEIVHQYGTDAESILGTPDRVATKVTELLEARYKDHEERTRKSGTRAVIYIFLTKILIGMGAELPYELLILGHINYFALGTNIVFHPVLLFLMVKTIRFPSNKNTQRVIAGVRPVLEGNSIDPIYIRMERMSVTRALLFTLFYGVLFVITFGLIISLLSALQFNIVSIALFIFFLAVVSYFGLRVRHKAARWKVAHTKETILGLLWHFFTLPIVRAGRWLSIKLSTINVFIFILDMIIETPFKMLLRTFDAFVNFLREEKENYY